MGEPSSGSQCQAATSLLNRLCQGLLVLAFGCFQPTATLAQAPTPRASSGLPGDLVYLREIEPTIIQDIRYATGNNFTGGVVSGYEAAECILTRSAAEALSKVQADLRSQHLTLKVYDCYRPKRAVAQFVGWVQLGANDGADTRHFHPNIPRHDLIALGYIARVSSHSHANAVDLSLVTLPIRDPDPGMKSNAREPCTAPASNRMPDNSVDMGTAFDCFDPKSHTLHDGIDPGQRKWRTTLLQSMERRGFRNYAREWWHFTFGSGRGPGYDFPIRASPAPNPSPP